MAELITRHEQNTGAQYIHNPMGDLGYLILNNTEERMNAQEFVKFMRDLQKALHDAFRIPYGELHMDISNINTHLKENGIPLKIQATVLDEGENPENGDLVFHLVELNAIEVACLEAMTNNVERFVARYADVFKDQGGFHNGMGILETIKFRKLFRMYYDIAYKPFYYSSEKPDSSHCYDLDIINLLMEHQEIPYRVWYDRVTNVITDVRKVNW